jgi:hypothetical protein
MSQNRSSDQEIVINLQISRESRNEVMENVAVEVEGKEAVAADSSHSLPADHQASHGMLSFSEHLMSALSEMEDSDLEDDAFEHQPVIPYEFSFPRIELSSHYNAVTSMDVEIEREMYSTVCDMIQRHVPLNWMVLQSVLLKLLGTNPL